MKKPNWMTPIKIAISFLLLLFLSWGGNLWVYSSMQLEKPFFLKQASTYSENENEMAIYFLENKSKEKKVEYTQFDELPFLTYRIEELEQYTYQVLKVLYYKPDKEALEWDNGLDILKLNEINVVYDDGSSDRVTIGEISIYPDSPPEEGSVVEHIFSEGSTDGDGRNALRMLQPAILEEVRLSLADPIDSVLHLKVNDLNYSDIPEMEQKKADVLWLTYQWVLPDKGAGSMTIYHPVVFLHFKLGNRSEMVEKVTLNKTAVQFSEEQVRSLVRKEEGNH